MLKKLRFVFLRFRRSSMRELLHRLEELLFINFLFKFSVITQPSFSVPRFNFEKVNGIKHPHFLGRVDEELTKEILHGKCFCLHERVESVTAFEKENYHKYFSKIQGKPNGPDIRAIWEKGRLQNLNLLLHAIQSADGRAERQEQSFVRLTLLEWLYENQFGYGVHYISAMECGLRIPLFLKALQGVESWPPEEAQKIIRAMYQYGWFIRNRLSLFSSLGNHTVTECVGLVFAGLVFQHMKVGTEWLKKGIELLEQECSHQILPDGGPVEQSFSYHRFVLDLYWLAIDFLELNCLHDCAGLKERVASGERFLAAMQYGQEPELRIGDSDDGHAIGPGLYPAIREEYQKAVTPDSITTLPNSGYTVIRSQKGGRLVMDHGPLGMAPLYNHGHADALSVLLSVDNVDFLVDPGTYQYNGDQKLRRYFKGTRAHNTVTIDGCDQAEQLTSFIWGEPYTVEWSRGSNQHGQEYLVASHNGYRRLREPVSHVRRLVWVDEEVFLLEDTFGGSGEHNFELNFHLYPNVAIEETSEGVRLQNGSRSVGLACIGERFSVIQGAKEPLCGWYSPSYGVLEKTITLQVKKTGRPSDTRFHTLLHLGEEVSEKDLEQVLRSCDIPS